MNDLILDPAFWIATLVAVVVKIRASPRAGFINACITTLVAVGSALVFTNPVLRYLELSPDDYAPAVAALVALTAEHLARQIVGIRIVDLIAAWRGKR